MTVEYDIAELVRLAWRDHEPPTATDPRLGTFRQFSDEERRVLLGCVAEPITNGDLLAVGRHPSQIELLEFLVSLPTYETTREQGEES